MLRAGIGTIALLLAGLGPLADARADGGPSGPEVATERRMVRTVRVTPTATDRATSVRDNTPAPASTTTSGRTVRRVVETPAGSRPVAVSPSSGTWVQQRWVSADSPRTTRVVWVRVPPPSEREAATPAPAPAPRRVVVARHADPLPEAISHPAPPPGDYTAPRSRVRLIQRGSLPCDT